MATTEGRYRARFAADPQDVRRAQALRWRAFRARREGAPREGVDADAFDDRALHGLVEATADGRLVACFRLIRFECGADIEASYSAQFYGLSRLSRHPGPLAEMGRFCTEPSLADPAALRVAWALAAGFVARERIAVLFGCTSFEGVEAERYAETFALLGERHLAPRRWLPRVKAPAVFRFAGRLRPPRAPDLKAALRAMPPLLRSYLAMGGWVSDHAVIDRDLGTLHVFTGLEVAAVPAARARALGATPA